MTAAGQHSRLPRESESETAKYLYGEEQSGIADPFHASHDDIRLILHKVLSSPEFSSVVQLRSFLSYVVSKVIDDRPDEIKGYTIAVEALGRDVSFNPITDPIVRVEAARLRQRLARYYTGSGKNDPIVIAIPKGSYVPAFTLRTDGAGNGRKNTPPAQSEISADGAASAKISRIVEPVSSDTGAGVANDRSDMTESAPLAEKFSEIDKPASIDTAMNTGNVQRGLRLPITIPILILTFFAGYALGAIL